MNRTDQIVDLFKKIEKNIKYFTVLLTRMDYEVEELMALEDPQEIFNKQNIKDFIKMIEPIYWKACDFKEGKRMKVVINTCYGGYRLSKDAYDYLGLEWDGYGFEFDNDRTNPKLIEMVEKLGKRANGIFADLKVVEIPDDVKWYIHEYDGVEEIYEEHRSWS